MCGAITPRAGRPFQGYLFVKRIFSLKCLFFPTVVCNLDNCDYGAADRGDGVSDEQG